MITWRIGHFNSRWQLGQIQTWPVEGRELVSDYTFTAKGRGEGKSNCCQVCGAEVIGCPIDDGCAAMKYCLYHYFHLKANEDGVA
jgi:hypothetical protein